ncbi:cysteine methyltransferase [Flavobacterium covae]|uniref:Methylated-DNA--protein-cysteine methyltransferase n=1 Tax=Flavobacterium columnare TaxID=996 RepID=A0AA94JMW5_9FLAO|nr:MULTISPECIES: methylated-DNA--[protein]-cysteine S-methyltransferase [Flavobacterium]AND64082.1 cysteine methyltransferase [Flavobacterium covae]MCH4829610.1 methylated-DNA--[protein]-cysteine S-methyltransferase [Flavobacterium columnare]MCH4831393.1 methylated-DNA--[protein]-cysteine S-methyltransferase [Flavobacterium columnare]OWP86804.1 cysteine methyltransferase [Flavobacterium covae]
MKTAFIHSPLGIIKIEGDQKGIASISVVTEGDLSVPIPQELLDAVNQLQEYFYSNRTNFSFPLSLQGTDFQKKVWNELLKIPFGKTISYLDLAKKLGDTKVIRAAASANGKNLLWIVVPCHRVIGTDGSLTGYAGGLWRKKWLLEHESSSKQQILF